MLENNQNGVAMALTENCLDSNRSIPTKDACNTYTPCIGTGVVGYG